MSEKKEGDEDADGSEYTLRTEAVKDDLDPELQEVILSRREKRRPDRWLFTAEGDGAKLIDVVAELEDADAAPPEGLNVVQRMGRIVTGTVAAGRIAEVRSQVVSMKAARRLRKTLHRSVADIRATPQQLREGLPAGLGGVDGSGVIVGVVDAGCDFAHPNFRRPDGTSRILFLWDQHGGRTNISPAGYPYGREFTNADINKALKTIGRTPYDVLNYRPEDDHGTHVLDIAAGSGSTSVSGLPNPHGVAPGADIIFVDASVNDFGEDESFGNSRRLLEAIKYVFDKEGTRPAVVNVSLNVDGGPHDGLTPVEKGIDELLLPDNRAVVIAAGNSRDMNHHVERTLPASAATTLRWEIQPRDETLNRMEVWYDRSEELELFLVSPRGVSLGPYSLRTATTILRSGRPAGRVIHRADDPNNHLNHLVLRFETRMEPGVWGVALRPSGGNAVHIHAWIESDDGTSSAFLDVRPSDTAHTIGSLACGQLSIAVSSYDPDDAQKKIAGLTAEGPTRDDKQKPEVSAPGVNISAAKALDPFNSFVTTSGTSNAAPHVTGLIALLLDAVGAPLSANQIRDAVMNTARRNPPAGLDWNPLYGMGRVDAVGAISSIVGPAPPLAFLQVQAAASWGDEDS